MKHRIKEFREAANLTQAELAEKIDVKLLTVHNLEHYKTRLTVDRLEELANLFGVSPFELLEVDMPNGINPTTGNRKVAVVGYVGAGAEVYPMDSFTEAEDEIDHVEIPVNVSKNAVALKITGDSQYPRFVEGDTIVYGDPRSDETSLLDMVGRDVVVRLTSGRMLLKVLQFSPAPGCWNLESYNQPEMTNQEISWASRIEAIVPR